jgi:TonB family protein
MARIIVQRNTRDIVPIPEVQVHLSEPELKTLQMVRFDDNSKDISGVIGSVSSPELARAQFVDPKSYAQRAGLSPGHSVTVLFVLEVLADGTVGAVTLLRGTGNPAVDDAAVAYVRLLRWTPGTVNHEAQAMRIQLPVTLANPA